MEPGSINVGNLWLFLIIGYVATVAIEVPILLVGLSPDVGVKERITTGLLLTAFTYPIVVLVLPALFTMTGVTSRPGYLLVAETFAPVAEVLFFRFIMNKRLLSRLDRDAVTIVVANLASFLIGELFLSRQIQLLVDLINGS